MPYYKSDDIETILVELNAGIVPTSIFLKNVQEKKDTFSGMNTKEARMMKRKWRKLKKKHNVKKCGISTAAWMVRKQLREENEIN